MNAEDLIIPHDARLRYIERRKKDLDSLRLALSSQAFEEFKRIGHQLKGNAASFGYPDLEKVAIQMEAAGEHQDVQEAPRQLEEYQSWLNRVSVHSA